MKGTKFKFEDDEDSQTLTYVGGLSYTTLEEQIPNVDLTIGVDAIMPKDQDVTIGVGGERERERDRQGRRHRVNMSSHLLSP